MSSMWSREKQDKARSDAKADAASNPESGPFSQAPRKGLFETPAAAAAPAAATPAPAPAPTPPSAFAAPAAAAAPAPTPAPSGKGSVLGASLRFKGDLVADEDLVVQGRIEGSILHSKSLTIGTDGVMTGNIRARRIVVEGRVDGDLYALECITVRETGKVTGSLFAPRVAIQEGARFTGKVDMQNAPAVPSTKRGSDGKELSDAEVDVKLAAS